VILNATNNLKRLNPRQNTGLFLFMDEDVTVQLPELKKSQGIGFDLYCLNCCVQLQTQATDKICGADAVKVTGRVIVIPTVTQFEIDGQGEPCERVTVVDYGSLEKKDIDGAFRRCVTRDEVQGVKMHLLGQVNECGKEYVEGCAAQLLEIIGASTPPAEPAEPAEPE